MPTTSTTDKLHKAQPVTRSNAVEMQSRSEALTRALSLEKNVDLAAADDCSCAGSSRVSNDDEDDYTMSETSSHFDSDDDSSDDEVSGDDSTDSYLDVTPAQKSAGLFLSLEMVQLLRKSTSAGNLFAAAIPPSTIARMTPARRTSGDHAAAASSSRLVFALQTKSPLESPAQHKSAEANIPRPKDTLVTILKEQGLSVKYHRYSDLPDYFVHCCVTSHSYELMNAVRRNDLATIQREHLAGTNLQCANKFQESLVHAVARRGLPDMLTYLHGVAGVSLRVCCDGGRTVLHDACWTGHPEFSSIGIILQDSPDLLYITDKRGFTPLDYIPKEAHEAWNAWLAQNKHLLSPRDLD
jgi:hypothetical protein